MSKLKETAHEAQTEADESGAKAAAMLRSFVKGLPAGSWAKRRRDNGEALHEPSERLANAIRTWSVEDAQSAWDEGGRVETCDHAADTAEWSRGLAFGARMWAGGWRLVGGQAGVAMESKSQEMAEWLDAKGYLFAQRNKKVDALAHSVLPGSEEWRFMMMEAAARWPRLFEWVEPGSPGLPAALVGLARGWVNKGWLSAEDGCLLGSKIASGCWIPRDGSAIPSKLGWIEAALSNDGLGGSMDDALWLNLFAREPDGGAERARMVLENTPAGPSQDALRKIAALGAVRGDTLLLAAAAERIEDWDWMVDASAASAAGQVVNGPSSSSEAMKLRGGRIPALHAAAMGPTRRAWSNQGLMAILSIPAARAAAAKNPAPAALARWDAPDLEWAAIHAPELVACDKKGRCIAHEWARDEGPWSVKRVASLARTSLGWMMSHPNAKGETPMGMLSGHDRTGKLPALFARWERGEVERDTLEPDGADGVCVAKRARL